MNPGNKALAIALLFVGLVLANYLASSLPARLDLTAEQIYTLSPGSKALLSRIEEPITLDFYYSENASGLPISYKNYAERVREMLRQYVRASGGKITLNPINPQPDTPEEEQATAAGLEPQTQPGGDPFYFGIVAIQADQQKAIPALQPQREQFLEYDLSELIYKVQQFDKKKLGLITSLPLRGSPGQPMLGQPAQDGQYVINEWQDTFDIVSVTPAATELPANLDALAVIHPENLTPGLQFAIDQFLLGGKPVFLAVDPSCQFFKQQGGEMAMLNGPQPNVSSDLPALFAGWGLSYDPRKVVGDNENAAEVQLQDGSAARYPVWLRLGKENFNSQAPPTADLNSLVFIEAGSIALRPGATVTFTPLVETSAKAGEIDSAALQFAQPDEIARQIVPSGKKTIAALVTGKFATAFPAGPPAEAPANAATAAPKKIHQPFLKESSASSTLIVVADTDWLFDAYSIEKVNFMGQAAARPLNDNLAFAANSLDFLSGSSDLISLRGNGSSERPFVVVERMNTRANEKYQQQLTGLEAELNDVQSKLTELQGKKSEGGRLVASPEVNQAIEDFQKQETQLRGERREIRRALREDIDALDHRLLAINLLATPLLVCAFGVLFYRSRRR
jgi:ABC-type uncharacterized transport system involved in gliding motility auxiliary subunit